MFIGQGIRIPDSSAEGEPVYSPLADNPAWWVKADGSLFTDAARTDPVDTNLDVVGSMTDESGNGAHFNQATTAAKPIYHTNQYNGLPAVSYDGVDDTLQLAGNVGLVNNQSNIVTYCLAIDAGVNTGVNTVIGEGSSLDSSQNWHMFIDTDRNLKFNIQNGAIIQRVMGASPFENVGMKTCIIEFNPTLSTLKVYVDGAQFGATQTVTKANYPLSTNDTRLGMLTVGPSVILPLVCKRAEAFRVDGAVDVARVHGYLAERWK